ncbi:amino acid transporter [Clostridia bacterium]|nr:amino acid transporter [Clostridia bacterium]
MEKVKRFRLFDCVLAVVCVVLTVESAAPAASIGNSQFFWWLLLLVCFCVPYGLISAELGTAYESEGGLCDWISRAFGRRWGSRVAWYYWVNFPLWIAAVSVLSTDNLPAIIGTELPEGVNLVIRLVFIWVLVLLSLRPVSQSKWMFNLSTAFKTIILGLLGIAGIYMAVTRGVANPLTPRSLLPGLDLTSLSFISVIIFNFLGFEVITTYVGDMPNPRRDIPRSIIWGGLAVMALYVLASFGVGAAIPTAEISPSMGVMDALGLLLVELPPWIVIALGVMLIFAMFSTLLSWSVGINYTARYCSREGGGMPKIFGKSAKNGEPLGASLMNGIVASALVLIAPLIPSDQLFWSFFALNLVMLLLSYLPLFPAFVKLRKTDADTPRPYRVFGGKTMTRVIAYVPLVLLIAALIFTVIPLDSSELADKLPLAVGSLIAIASGEIIAARSKK